jgi:hypothetical protein
VACINITFPRTTFSTTQRHNRNSCGKLTKRTASCEIQGPVISACLFSSCATDWPRCCTVFLFYCLSLKRWVRKGAFTLMISISTIPAAVGLPDAPFPSEWNSSLLFPVFSADITVPDITAWKHQLCGFESSTSVMLCGVFLWQWPHRIFFQKTATNLMRSLFYILCLFL